LYVFIFGLLAWRRLIPCRSQTDMQLAQHLLSPLSHRAGDHYDSEQQDSSRQVTRILNFGTKVVKAKPFSLVTASLACGTTPKPKFKIPTKPDRVMAAPGTFLDCGKFVCWILILFFTFFVFFCLGFILKRKKTFFK
jgi:hypothetical protein